MDCIESLLGHMSSTFNREIILPKEAEITKDETFKWRALKNNQFARRSKHLQTRCIKTKSLVTDAQENSANNIIIAIENDISSAEIQNVLSQQSICIEYQASNKQTVKDCRQHKKKAKIDESPHKSSTHPLQTFKFCDGIFQTNCTSSLFKQMSSAFNAIKTDIAGSNKINACQRKTIRKSNRLRQSSSNYSIHPKQAIMKYHEQNHIDSNFFHDTQNSKIIYEYNAFEPQNATKSFTFSCKKLQENLPKGCKEEEKQKRKPTVILSNNMEAYLKKNEKPYNKIVQGLNLTTSKKSIHKSINKKTIEKKEEIVLSIQNEYSRNESIFQFHERFSRPIKLSAKILANKKLRHGFELQNNARLKYKAYKPVEMHKKTTKLPGTPCSNLQSNSHTAKKNKIRRFLNDIKKLQLVNKKSPENDKSLSKSQLQTLQILKENHLRELGLLRTNINKQTLQKLKGKQLEHDAYFKTNSLFKKCQLEEKHKQNNRPIALDCYCDDDDNTSYSTIMKQLTMKCTAIDDVNGQLIKCGNKLEGRIRNIVRPSLRSSYQIVCAWHNRRFRRHSCCPQCGIYCTQGEFAVCSRRHIFHIKCIKGYEGTMKQKLKTKLLIKCLHCGVEENSSSLKTIIHTIRNECENESKIFV